MSDQQDVRASFRRFPGWTQHFWTWFTGKALPGQEPLIRHSWWSYLGITLTGFFVGLSLSVTAIAYRYPYAWAALAAGWALTIWASRTMILVIAHQCIHRQFSGSRRLDDFLGELVTVLTLFQDAHAFKVEHIQSHHRPNLFATTGDPPVQVLLRLGFRPGMSKRRLWLNAWLVFVSPQFYLRGFWDRIRCNLLSGTWRRLGFAAWVSFWLSLPAWLPNGGWALVLAFAVPVVPVAQLSALLDKLGEHAWLTPPDPRHRPCHYHVSASWARFCGSPVPAAALPLWQQVVAWPVWIATMLFFHLPSRLFVVVGDLPNHDHHHRHPRTPHWAVAAYARQRAIDRGDAAGPPYTEIWGMGAAIDRVFDALSKAAPVAWTDKQARDATDAFPVLQPRP